MNSWKCLNHNDTDAFKILIFYISNLIFVYKAPWKKNTDRLLVLSKDSHLSYPKSQVEGIG